MGVLQQKCIQFGLQEGFPGNLIKFWGVLGFRGTFHNPPQKRSGKALLKEKHSKKPLQKSEES